MIDFKITADTERLQRKLNNLINAQMPYATSIAINETLKTLEIYNKDLMKKAFRNPVPYTMNAFYVQFANKRTLTGILHRKDKVVGRHYLEVQDTGGPRGLKGFEKNFLHRGRNLGTLSGVLPTKHTPKDRYGNMSMAFINKVSSQMGLQKDAAQNKPYSLKTKSGKRSTGIRYFSPRPDHPLAQKGGLGVYQTRADPLGQERGAGRVQKVMTFAQNVPTYKKRTDFEPKMKRAAERLMPNKMREGIRRAMATARLR
ncbi:MAG: hypothetical protein ACR2IJ_05140 [Fluviibacter sp.]